MAHRAARLVLLHVLVVAGPAAGNAVATPRRVAAQQAPADHWKLVPTPATGCFPDDGFSEKLDAARAAIRAEIERQRKVNEAAKERFDDMDMMEKAQRMQAFMAKNPQAAMKMMQASQAAGAAGHTAVPAAGESARRLDAELERHRAKFAEAVEQARKPVRAKQDALVRAKTVAVGEAGEPAFTTAADLAQYEQLIAEENAAYETACAPFFGAGGTFHEWLASYRTEVVDPTISAGDEGDIMVMQMAAMDLPGGGYRSTVPMEQSLNYIHRMDVVWRSRQNRVTARIGLRK